MENNIYDLRHAWLFVTRDCDKDLKKMTKLEMFQGRWALVDHLTYWKTKKQSGYCAVIKEPQEQIYSITLYDPKGRKIFRIPRARFADLVKVLKLLWMSVQHLMITETDGQNGPWDLESFYKWWEARLKVPYERASWEDLLVPGVDFKKGDENDV